MVLQWPKKNSHFLEIGNSEKFFLNDNLDQSGTWGSILPKNLDTLDLFNMSYKTIGIQKIAAVGLIIKQNAIMLTYRVSFETNKFRAMLDKQVSRVLTNVLNEAQGITVLNFPLF